MRLLTVGLLMLKISCVFLGSVSDSVKHNTCYTRGGEINGNAQQMLLCSF